MVKVSRNNELGPIVAEQILATFHGIKTSEQISVEIAHIDQQICFYIAFPKRLRHLVEGQIYAQYPDVEIEEVEDYARNLSSRLVRHAAGLELRLSDPDFDPIKRYPQFEDKITGIQVDPMAGITAALTKVHHPQDQVWVQIVFRPLPSHWRMRYLRCAWILNKRRFSGIEFLQDFFARAFCVRKTWIRVLFFPLYFFFWIDSLFSGELEEGTSKSHERETADSARMDKIVKLLYDVNIRVVYAPFVPGDGDAVQSKFREIAGAFKQFDIPYLNSLKPRRRVRDFQTLDFYRMRWIEKPFVLNSEELATLWHLPNKLVQTPLISWARSRKLEPPPDLPNAANTVSGELTLLGKSDFRGVYGEFGIRRMDRRRHMYVIGKTGMGKSTLLENMIFSDIQAGKGVGVIDPHGDLADSVLDFIPAHRTNDVMVIDPSDREFPVAFNMLESQDSALNSIIASGLVGVFKRLYGESWGPRLEYILRNTILSLLEYPNTTMLGITRILTDEVFRERVVMKITDPVVKNFWIHEFQKFSEKQRIEAISPILNKVGQFLSSSIIRNIVGQPKSAIDFRFAMDKGKIVIINLSKGKIGEDNSALLGSLFVTKFQLDAMSRANIPPDQRRDFYLYVDEFQNFATESFATILSEARKYCLNLTIANQYIAQMPEEVRDAVFGNVGSILSFQIGYDDADSIANQFGDEELVRDLVSLSRYNAYLRLLVDGMPTRTFSMTTMPPPSAVLSKELVAKKSEEKMRDGKMLGEKRREIVIKMSRERYSQTRAIVEEKIQRWAGSEAPVRTKADFSFTN